MIKLDSGNVLLKPSHRRQFTAWVRRLSRLAQHFCNYFLNFSIQRTGRQYELKARFTPAKAHSQAFECRLRQHDYLDGLRELCRQVTDQLHNQYVRRRLQPSLA